jgi:hypothetical protein
VLVIVIVPEVVIGLPVTLKPPPSAIATEVTVPVLFSPGKFDSFM